MKENMSCVLTDDLFFFLYVLPLQNTYTDTTLSYSVFYYVQNILKTHALLQTSIVAYPLKI